MNMTLEQYKEEATAQEVSKLNNLLSTLPSNVEVVGITLGDRPVAKVPKHKK